MSTVKYEAPMSIEERLTAIETTLVHLNTNMTEMKHDMYRKFDALEQKFEVKFLAIDSKFESKFEIQEAKLDKKLTAMEERLDRRIDDLQNRIWINFIWMMGGFIGLAGLIARSQHWI